MGYFVVRKTNTGVKFDLHAGNHEVIATSEVYSGINACRAGVASVAKNAPIAAVEGHYSPYYNEFDYTETLAKGCREAGIAAFTGDGLNRDFFNAGCAALEKAVIEAYYEALENAENEVEDAEAETVDF